MTPVAVAGVRGADRSPREFVEPCGRRGVVRVPVREQDELHPPLPGQLLQMLLIQGPGVHHYRAPGLRAAQQVRVGPVQAHGPGIRGQPETGQVAGGKNRR